MLWNREGGSCVTTRHHPWLPFRRATDQPARSNRRTASAPETTGRSATEDGSDGEIDDLYGAASCCGTSRCFDVEPAFDRLADVL